MARIGAAGVAAALGSAVLFGVTTPLAKQLLAGTHPLLIAGLLYLGSGVGVSLLRVIQDRGWSPTGLTARDWPWLALTTLIGGIIAPALLMLGLARADAADASLLLNLEVVFTAVLAWLVFKEPANSRVVLGLVAICGGGLILVWPGRFATSHSLPALSLIVAACLCWALDNNLTRKVSASDARVLAAIKGLVAGGYQHRAGVRVGGLAAGAVACGGDSRHRISRVWVEPGAVYRGFATTGGGAGGRVFRDCAFYRRCCCDAVVRTAGRRRVLAGGRLHGRGCLVARDRTS